MAQLSRRFLRIARPYRSLGGVEILAILLHKAGLTVIESHSVAILATIRHGLQPQFRAVILYPVHPVYKNHGVVT